MKPDEYVFTKEFLVTLQELAKIVEANPLGLAPDNATIESTAALNRLRENGIRLVDNNRLEKPSDKEKGDINRLTKFIEKEKAHGTIGDAINYINRNFRTTSGEALNLENPTPTDPLKDSEVYQRRLEAAEAIDRAARDDPQLLQAIQENLRNDELAKVFERIETVDMTSEELANAAIGEFPRYESEQFRIANKYANLEGLERTGDEANTHDLYDQANEKLKDFVSHNRPLELILDEIKENSGYEVNGQTPVDDWIEKEKSTPLTPNREPQDPDGPEGPGEGEVK